METWRIAIPIVVFILCMIGAWYVVRLRIEEIRSRTYVYPKTGHDRADRARIQRER